MILMNNNKNDKILEEYRMYVAISNFQNDKIDKMISILNRKF